MAQPLPDLPATLPDQPDDWTEPGAHLVHPGVYRIPLPLPLEGLNAVNVYLVEDREGPVLIDSGWAGPETEKALAEALRPLGHGLGDLAQILVTHAHWDHYTQALVLRESLGVRVRIGRGERHSIEGLDLSRGAHPEQVAQLRSCGARELADAVAAMPVTEEEWAMPFGPPDAWLDDLEEVPLTERKLKVLATPGHTRGHVVFGDPAAGLLFAGDHVLPHITPSIGFEHSPERSPLRSYQQSLCLVRELPDALLLPAHGPVTTSTHTRVDELLAHHEERLDAVIREVRKGARSAHDVARALPWTRRLRRLDDLPGQHRMLAILEIDAHLEVLAETGVLCWATVDGVRHFALAG
ncbi:MBL fold metallo-hydrolase [Streptomyces sp. NBC_00237]|uniref:MBL fold metallo-hydrolase n=1 Tax=Streptomyces sp. NBC_00237 TaxID=2975687 RepID=UPI002253D922|nr:MBL fold metallo-hydrolase [Streptomyces sp. NBC_00237]MCX5202839.1 MBL fold metallo-hydrolase [Streptomyces sp. NBC_00237]